MAWLPVKNRVFGWFWFRPCGRSLVRLGLFWGAEEARSGVGDVGNDGGGGGGGQRGDEAVGVGQGESGSNNLGGTPLPLGRGGNGSLLGGVSLGEGSLGGDDILGVSDLDSLEDGGGGLDAGEDRGRGLDSLEDRGSEVGSASNGEVGALDPEAVDIVGDVVHSLDEAVGINILVGAGGHAISVAGLSPGRWTSGMAERELTKLILSVELVGGGGGGDCYPWGVPLRGGGAHASC